MRKMIDDSGKMVIYQVLPRLFGNKTKNLVSGGTCSENGCGKFSDFTMDALSHIRELGVTHIWYTGVIEHATQTDYSQYGIKRDHPAIVKGRAGSPYAIKDYYDVDPDLADSVPHRMEEFQSLLERTHNAGMKVIMDFVPNHVAREYHSDACPPYVSDFGYNDDVSKSFSPHNNFYYIPNQPLMIDFIDTDEGESYTEYPAKATGNDCFSFSPGKDDWYETVKLNYGVDYMGGRCGYFDPMPDTWLKMKDVLLFWAQKGVDGFRCDMAEMVPVEFWHWVIPQVKAYYNVIFIAEIYNPSEYWNYINTGNFDYLYDKVGLYDTLRSVMVGNSSAKAITHCWQSVGGMQKRMLNFLENHDEQRIASVFFADSALAGIPGMIVSALMNTNPVMIYFGQELGERGMQAEGFSGLDGRTSIFDYCCVPAVQSWVDDAAFNDELLPDEQRQLRNMYKTILRFASADPVVGKGDFYDIMYANINNMYMDADKQYAFVRKYGNSVLLVISNFDKESRDIRLNLPAEMFETLGIEENRAAEVEDILCGRKNISTLTSEWGYQVHLPAYGGKILKFTYK